MQIVDTHCDVLYKLYKDPHASFYQNSKLDVNIKNLKLYGKFIQCMAIYVPQEIPFANRYIVALEYISIFQEKIIKPSNGSIVQIFNSDMIHSLEEHQIGVILTIEGCDCIGDQKENFETLYQYGARIFGLTWNYANLIADGVLEERGAGLSNLGKEFITWVNEKNAWIDVSHVSENGFWDTIQLGNKVMASHSNTKKICDHKRNLSDDQIKSLINKEGYIGITFVPQFLSTHNPSFQDILRHLEHICTLGGENHVGFGSDFDGFDQPIEHLDNSGDFLFIGEKLGNYFSENLVEKFLWKNFIEKCEF